MNLGKAWQQEIAGITTIGILLGLLGVWTGYFWDIIIAAFFLYLAWHLYQLTRLTLWLHNPKRYSRPSLLGLWRTTIELVEGLRGRGKKRKRKLRRLLSGFHESTNALPDATVVLDNKGQVEWWNSVAERLLGLVRKRDKGANISELVRDPVFHDYLNNEAYHQSLQMPAPIDDRINLEVRIVPYGKGKRLLQARDITLLSQLETVRRDFVANVSHEMRTPLTVIQGYLEAMNDSSRDEIPLPWCHALGQMQQQAVRMQHIVEDLLLLSRLESCDNTANEATVDITALLVSLKEGGEALSINNHQIELDIEAGLDFYGSVTELESAFSNLVFNAVRYTPKGGRICLKWWRDKAGTPCFSVTDTGIGIAAEHIPRLTERFYRVDVGRSRQSGGTGLGLAIVKYVLSRHGGQLHIESQLGEGSTFRCCFPPERACNLLS